MNRDRQEEQQRQTTNRKEAALKKQFPRSHGQFSISGQNPKQGFRKCGFLKCQSGMKSEVRSDMSAFASKHEVTRGTSASSAQYPAPPIPAATSKYAAICFIE
jgi:hypothetical protein